MKESTEKENKAFWFGVKCGAGVVAVIWFLIGVFYIARDLGIIMAQKF